MKDAKAILIKYNGNLLEFVVPRSVSIACSKQECIPICGFVFAKIGTQFIDESSLTSWLRIIQSKDNKYLRCAFYRKGKQISLM